MTSTDSTCHRYFDGATAQARSVALHIDDTALAIADPEHQRVAHWPMREIRVVSKNVVSGELILRLEPDRHARLHVATGNDQTRLLSAHPHLARWKSRARWSLAKGFMLWGGIGVALSFVAYLGWARAAIWLADRLPEDFEQRLGQLVQSAVVNEQTLCHGADGQRALEAFVQRLVKDKPANLMVIRQGQANAFTAPGRSIFVFSGLIQRAKDPEIFAGVLAHEVAHTELRHPARAFVHNLGVGAVLSLIFSETSLSGTGYIATALSYSREMEREADQRGIAMLKAAGIRADGLNRFFQDLQKTKAPILPRPFTTHPDLGSRIEATKQPATGGPAMTATEWQAVKKMCGS